MSECSFSTEFLDDSNASFSLLESIIVLMLLVGVNYNIDDMTKRLVTSKARLAMHNHPCLLWRIADAYWTKSWRGFCPDPKPIPGTLSGDLHELLVKSSNTSMMFHGSLAVVAAINCRASTRYRRSVI